jgi:sialidase-1
MRTDGFDGKLAYARSTDGGKSFEHWRDGGFFGHPFHAIHLPDGRILLVYGYRKEPFGIRAKILNPECTDIETAPEFVLRDDGGNFDIGYPWVALLPNGNVLVAYYFNIKDGTRHIAGSILKVE